MPSSNRAISRFVAICLLAGTSIAGVETPLTLGIVMDGSSQAEREPLRTYLTKAVGRPVRLVVPDSYREIIARLGDDTYDFACLGALMYIRAHAQYGVIPLVQRDTDLHYHTVFITGAHTSIYELKDLVGRQFAFGDVDSTSAHLMALYELKQAGIDPSTDLQVRFSGSHPATAAIVETGVVDAGAIDESVFNYLVSTGKVDPSKVRVFYTSKPYIDYVYVARKNVPEVERKKFTDALLALKEGTDNAALRILRGRKFILANDREYTLTRQIAHDLGMF
jgi:phosphonate transport system substrate-binding protein